MSNYKEQANGTELSRAAKGSVGCSELLAQPILQSDSGAGRT